MATVVLAVSMGAIFMSIPAGASGSSSVTCTKLKITASTATVSKCSPTSGTWSSTQKKDYKTLSGSVAGLATGGSLNWAAGGGTVVVSAPTLTTNPAACPSKDTSIVATGTVTGGLSPTPTQVGDVFSVTLCENSKSKITLAKGTTIDF
jgi:hypothetical protein